MTRRTVDSRFGRTFHQAVEHATKIHFALDDIPDIGVAIAAGRRGFCPGNFTNAELHYLMTYGSPIFKAVQQKRCKALYTALTKSPKAPEYAVGEGSERSNVERSVGGPP